MTGGVVPLPPDKILEMGEKIVPLDEMADRLDKGLVINLTNEQIREEAERFQGLLDLAAMRRLRWGDADGQPVPD